MAGVESVCGGGDDGSVAFDFVGCAGAFCAGSPSKETGMDDSAGEEPGRQITIKNMKRTLAVMMAALVSFGAERAEIKNISVNGGMEEGKARIVIEAALQGLTAAEREKLLYSTTLNQTVRITREKQIHTIAATFDVLQGEPKELTLVISGEGEIKSVTGEMLQDWSVRQETNGVRALVVRPKRVEKKDKNDLGWPTQLVVTITAERATQISANPQALLSFAAANPALFN